MNLSITTGQRRWVPHRRDGFIVAKVGIRAQHEPLALNPERNVISTDQRERRDPRISHFSQSANTRVPHRRDGFIVAKAGIHAQHEPLYLNPERNVISTDQRERRDPRISHFSQSANTRVPHRRDGFIVAKAGIRAQHEPLYLNRSRNVISADQREWRDPRISHFSQSANTRVPHRRDGFIVAKAGIRAQHEPLYLNRSRNVISADQREWRDPRISHFSQSADTRVPHLRDGFIVAKVGIRAYANRLLLLQLKSVALIALIATTLSAHAAPPEKPTWRSQIAPIIYARCTTCHHTGGSGPFPLTTYADVKRYASVIAPAVESRYMPPWLPSPGHGDLADSRRLSDAELALIRQWIATGTLEGGGPIPTAPTYNADWQLGPPDLILETKTAVEVPATGTDIFLNVILPNPATGTRWVRAMEIKPGSPRIVHHANVLIDRTASLRRAHPSDWQQGIPGMDINVDSGDNFDPDSHFLFWKPDSTALIEPEGMPWRLDEGNDLVLNLHLKPSGKEESTRVRIGLYFTDKPATRHPMLLQLQHDAALDIPPGDASFPIEDSLKLPVAVDVLGIYPHAHYLCKRMEAWATLPSGQRRDLVLITDWDINRQSVYRLAHPLPLPAGSVLHMRYLYDNSAANPRNPHTPPVRVRAGNRSEDEMGHFWIQVIPQPSSTMTETHARESLERAWMESVLHKSPQDPIALYNLASLDLTEGKPAAAADRYRKLLAEKSNDPRTLTALGSALEASGDLQAAQTKFRAAHAADPTYADATFDLAALDLRLATASESAANADANLTEAESLFLTFLAAHPNDSDAEHQLALLYAAEGRLADSLTHLHRWWSLTPTDPEPHRALAQVYMQMGQLPDAIREQKAVVTLLPNSSNDWSDLGVMQARNGDKPAARRSLEQALKIDPTNQAAQSNLARL